MAIVQKTGVFDPNVPFAAWNIFGLSFPLVVRSSLGDAFDITLSAHILNLFRTSPPDTM